MVKVCPRIRSIFETVIQRISRNSGNLKGGKGKAVVGHTLFLCVVDTTSLHWNVFLCRKWARKIQQDVSHCRTSNARPDNVPAIPVNNPRAGQQCGQRNCPRRRGLPDPSPFNCHRFVERRNLCAWASGWAKQVFLWAGVRWSIGGQFFLNFFAHGRTLCLLMHYV